LVFGTLELTKTLLTFGRYFDFLRIETRMTE